MMEKTNHKQPEVIEAADFDPEKYQGRDVVFVKVPAEDRSIGREVNFFGLRLRASIDHHPAIVGTMGAGVLGWEMLTTRNTVGKMLMTDDEFAKDFRSGALMDIRERNLDEFTRFHSRESKITQVLSDPVNRFMMQWNVGKEVKARGVGVAEALGAWRWGHWAKALGAAAAVGYSVLEMKALKDAPEPEPARPDPLLGDDAPKDWQGKVFTALKEASI